MPVYKLKEEMPYTELLNWIEFFNRRPVGWREDIRTYLFLKTQGLKEPPEQLFPSIGRIKQREQDLKEIDQPVIKGKILDMMLKARNGDSSRWQAVGGLKNVNKV